MPKYPLASAFIGILQIFDASFLVQNHGIVGATTMVLSLAEFIWAIVSVVVLIRLKMLHIRILAAVFVAYNIFGWISGMLIPPSGDQFIVPEWSILAGGMFGLIFAIGSASIAFRPKPAE